MPARAAVVLGASGSVGGALIEELLRSRALQQVATLVRRSQPEVCARAREAGLEWREQVLPDMHPAQLEAATRQAAEALAGEVVGLSALGVGAGTAKLSLEQHRAIDVQLNAAFARGLRASGRVQHLALLSAVGADPTAATTGSGLPGLARYARVKGEAEAAARAEGPAILSLLRPAMILGSRHTPWLLEKLIPAVSFATPKNYRCISVAQIARAMVALACSTPAGSSIYHWPEMLALGSAQSPA